MPAFTAFLQTCAGAAVASLGTKCNKSNIGREWAQGMLGHTLGTTLLAPNSTYPNCNMESWGGDFDAPIDGQHEQLPSRRRQYGHGRWIGEIHQVEHLDANHLGWARRMAATLSAPISIEAPRR